MPIEINSVWILHTGPLKQNSTFCPSSNYTVVFFMFEFVNNNAHSKPDGRKDGLQFCERHSMKGTPQHLGSGTACKTVAGKLFICLFDFTLFLGGNLQIIPNFLKWGCTCPNRTGIYTDFCKFILYIFWYIKPQYTNVDPEIQIWSCQSSSKGITDFNQNWQ